VTGWVVVPELARSEVEVSRKRTVCPLGQFNSMRRYAPTGAGNVLFSTHEGGMEKGISLHQISAARELLKRYGIRACFFLQFGYPNETWADIQSTIRMVRETVPDDVGVSVSYPLPKTKFYESIATDMNSNCNWLESGDMSVMFRATYGSEFYAALHNALHLEVEMLNGRTDRGIDRRRLHKLWAQVQQELVSTSGNFH